MRDDISLAQPGVLVACTRMDSFSAAARKLGRTQSVVSLTVAKLEARLGIQHFDRSAGLPLLTDEWRALLDQAPGSSRGVSTSSRRVPAATPRAPRKTPDPELVRPWQGMAGRIAVQSFRVGVRRTP
jgi:DNA-binding transcriptional LysR family regulator